MGRTPAAERGGRKAFALAGSLAHRIRVPDAPDEDDPRVEFRRNDLDGGALPISVKLENALAFLGQRVVSNEEPWTFESRASAIDLRFVGPQAFRSSTPCRFCQHNVPG